MRTLAPLGRLADVELGAHWTALAAVVLIAVALATGHVARHLGDAGWRGMPGRATQALAA